MTNLTDVTNDQLQALKDFANAESKQLVDELEEILDDVAKTGQYIYPWHFMKPLYACKLDQVTSEFLSASPPLNNDGTKDEEEIKNLEDFRDKLLQTFDKFVLAPFTIQRVSEMLTEPRKHYKSTAKFFRGLEKNILVVSTIDPVPSDQRPVLKRSRYDENPLDKQNGYVDTALKPQLKKIHLEESDTTTDEIITEEDDDEQKEEECVDVEESDTTTTETPTPTTTTTTTITEQCDEKTDTACDPTTDGLESMLVCNESVDNPAPSTTTTTDVTVEEPSCSSSTVEQNEEALPEELPGDEVGGNVKNDAIVAEEEIAEKPIDES